MCDSVCFVPFFKSLDDLYSTLEDYIEGFDFLVLKDMLFTQSPWCLLKIFLYDAPFGSDYICCDDKGNKLTVFSNSSIVWHLEAISTALLRGTIDLSECYGIEYSVPFYYTPTKLLSLGQPKMCYSLLYFIMSLTGSYSVACEGGGGVGEGGDHHKSIGRILADKEINFTLNMIDPLQDEGVVTEGGLTMHRQKGFLFADSVLDIPVYCDIFDNANWVAIQESIKAPIKMTKHVFGVGVKGRLSQPYHAEVRGLLGNKQFAYVLQSFNSVSGFDNCCDCLKWKSLIKQFRLNSELLLRELINLGIRPCVSVVGATTVQHIIHSSTQKGFELSGHLAMSPEIFPRSVQRSMGVKKVPSGWEKCMLKYFRDLNLKVYEYKSFKTPLYTFDPSIASPNGVEFYRDYRDVKIRSKDFIVEINDSFVGNVLDHFSDCTEVDNMVEGTNNLIRFSGPSDKLIIPDIVDVKVGWVLPGMMIRTRCDVHSFSSGKSFEVTCGGITCGRDLQLFGWVYADKYVIARINSQTLNRYTTILSGFFNVAIDYVNKSSLLSIIDQKYREYVRQQSVSYPIPDELCYKLYGQKFEIVHTCYGYQVKLSENRFIKLSDSFMDLNGPSRKWYPRKHVKEKGNWRMKVASVPVKDTNNG